MDSIVTAIFLFCIGVLMEKALCLKCYECLYMTYDSNDKEAKDDLADMAKLNDKWCKDFTEDSTKLKTCGWEGDGIDWVCTKSDFKAELKSGSVTAEIDLIGRGCDIKIFDTDCTDDINGFVQAILEVSAKADGTMCSCDDKDGCNGSSHVTATAMGVLVAAFIASWINYD